MAEDFGFFSSSSESGAPGEAEEDPAAAFLAQQESEIAGIERAEPPEPVGFGDLVTTPVNGDLFPENDPLGDGYSIIAQAQEPESIRRWREEQKKRLEELDAASKVTEQEWREKAKKDLEEWHIRQNEQMEKTKASNRIADKAFYQQPNADVIGYVASDENFISDSKDEEPGSEWEKVARLCDFNPKSSKQAKDVSRMRSVLISLKQSPLAC
ncbi:clathrin light chain B isoform X1 [Rhinatrema bivittatum]|uniref:clathrin light chain B isoform X1 n=1 Tax=Rhinatrema bivittatum TaxID=194408 RepID=UPI00112CEFB5|nr:clathrin light chain B isoform X1 [Rhinatrema bivittatum]